MSSRRLEDDEDLGPFPPIATLGAMNSLVSVWLPRRRPRQAADLMVRGRGALGPGLPLPPHPAVLRGLVGLSLGLSLAVIVVIVVAAAARAIAWNHTSFSSPWSTAAARAASAASNFLEVVALGADLLARGGTPTPWSDGACAAAAPFRRAGFAASRSRAAPVAAAAAATTTALPEADARPRQRNAS